MTKYQKISITISLFTIFIVIINIISCQNNSNNYVPKQGDINKYGFIYTNLPLQNDYDEYKGYMIVEMDSCEYILTWFGSYHGGGSLTHRGRCKYCIERNKLLFKNLKYESNSRTIKKR